MHYSLVAGPDERSSIEKWEVQVRKGCLELAILASLWAGPMYGLEILRRISGVSGLVLAQGTVYPLLNRLRAEGWVDASWVETGTGHPRKYYRLTQAGRRQAAAMARVWSVFAPGLDSLVAPVRRDDRDG